MSTQRCPRHNWTYAIQLRRESSGCKYSSSSHQHEVCTCCSKPLRARSAKCPVSQPGPPSPDSLNHPRTLMANSDQKEIVYFLGIATGTPGEGSAARENWSPLWGTEQTQFWAVGAGTAVTGQQSCVSRSAQSSEAGVHLTALVHAKCILSRSGSRPRVCSPSDSLPECRCIQNLLRYLPSMKCLPASLRAIPSN